MSELAKEVDYFHVKVKLVNIMVIEVLIYYFVTFFFLVVYKESNVVLRYGVKVKSSVFIEEERFIFHVFSDCANRWLDMNR